MTDIPCVKSINGSLTDVLLTNEIGSFYHTAAFEFGLSELILKSFLIRILNTEILKTSTKMISSMN